MDLLAFNFFEDDQEIQTVNDYDDEKFNLSLDFFEAIEGKKSLEELDKILESGADINCINFENPLLYSISLKSSFDLIKYLISKGADLYYKNKLQENALFYSINYDLPIEVIEFFLSKNFDINEITKETVLHCLMNKKNPNFEVLKLLLNSGADLTLKNKNNPIHLAFINQAQLEIIKFLLSKTTNYEETNNESYLLIALKHDSMELIKAVLEFQKDIKKTHNKRNYLTFAFEKGSPLEIISILVENGLSVHEKDTGKFPLHYIFSHQNYKEYFNFLQNQKADLTISTNENILHIFLLTHPKDPFFETLLELGIDINQQNVDGQTPLHLVIKINLSFSLIQKMVNLGANLNLKNEYTPFHMLCHNDLTLEELDFLIKAGADTNSENGMTPLLTFLSKSVDKEKIQLFFDAGAKIPTNPGESPISIICGKKETTLEILQMFLDRECDPNFTKSNSYYQLPIIRAIYNNLDMSIIKKLIELKAELNPKDGDTPLICALRNSNNHELIKLLIDSGSDPKLNYYRVLEAALNEKISFETFKLLFPPNFQIETEEVKKGDIVRLMTYHPNYEKIKYMIDLGLTLNIELNWYENALENIIRHEHTDLRTYELLLEKGFNINQSFYAHTPLTSVITKNNKNLNHVIEYFIEKGADVNQAQSFWYTKQTPLIIAAENQNFQIMELLLKHGAKIEDDDSSILCGLILRKKANPKVVQFLIDKGANIEFIQEDKSANIKNRTPLHFAANYENPEVVEILLKNGANGRTPLTSLKYNHIAEKINLLIQYGSNMLEKEYIKEDNSYFKKEVVSKFRGYHYNFASIQESTDIWDYKIPTFGGSSVSTNKSFLQCRIGEENMNQALEVFGNMPSNEVLEYLKCLYLGFESDDEQFENFKNISLQIGIEKYIEKLGRNGLQADLKKLYENEESKDFIIIKGEEKIKVHKVILFARSGLFKGMFISVEDDSNCVNDYSECSLESLKALIYFFYLDEFPPNLKLSREFLAEMNSANKFFQVEGKEMFKYLLKRIENQLILGETVATKKIKEENEIKENQN